MIMQRRLWLLACVLLAITSGLWLTSTDTKAAGTTTCISFTPCVVITPVAPSAVCVAMSSDATSCVIETRLFQATPTNTPTPTATPTATPTPTTNPLYTNLVSYWKLSEASGTRSDSKGTNHLTDNNSVAQVAGQLGNASGYTAAALQWLSVSAGTTATGSAMSVSFWVNQNSVAATNYTGIIQKDNYPTNRSWAIETNDQAGDIKFYFALTTTDALVHYGVTPASSLTATAWHHVVWVFDGSQPTNATRLVCYVNGVAKVLTFSGSAVPASLPAATTDLEFGRQTFGRYLSGGIDDVGLWDRALSSGDVTALYNGGAGFALY